MDRMTSYFAGKLYVSKTLHIDLDPDSFTKRMDRVRGVAVHNVHETMKICTAHWPKGLRSSPRQHYSGTTATNALGPVVLPDISSLWHVSWPVKKDIYGKHGLIPVGGKAPGEDDTGNEADGPGRATPPPQARNAGTSEPVAWHSMPELFWQEVLFDFKVGAVIDLTLVDGLLAMAALHARIPYTGLVFTRKHADDLLQRLQSFVLARAAREGGTWYDPRLVEPLTASKPKANEKAKTNATSETKAGTKPKRKKRARLATKPSGTGRASKTEKSENKSGSGEDNTNKTTKRRAVAKEDADTEAGDTFASSERSCSTREESGESCGAE
jgi:hypothetical protein